MCNDVVQVAPVQKQPLLRSELCEKDLSRAPRADESSAHKRGARSPKLPCGIHLLGFLLPQDFASIRRLVVRKVQQSRCNQNDHGDQTG